jgi:hypothetical protein
MSSEGKVERSAVRYEPETGFICVVYPPGRFEEDMARDVIANIMEHHRSECPGQPAFLLIDARYVTGISPEARKVVASARYEDPRNLDETKTYLANFGGSFAFRALANLVVKALMLVSTEMIATVEADEASARAWLSEQRRTYLARKSVR